MLQIEVKVKTGCGVPPDGTSLIALEQLQLV